MDIGPHMARIVNLVELFKLKVKNDFLVKQKGSFER